MQAIALTAEGCKPYIGKPVCAVLQDGSEVTGYLHGIEDNRLLLRLGPDWDPEGEAEAVLNSAKTGKKKKRKPLRTSAYAPFFFRGGLLALDLAIIAALFLIPFFLW